MKKLVIILAAVCVIFAGVIGYLSSKNSGEAVSQPEATVEPAAEEATATVPPVQTLDYEALYAAHEPDEVVLTVDGKDMTWDEYFYWINYYGQSVESYFSSMATYYGTESSWSDKLDETQTYAEYVTGGAAAAAKELAAIEGFAEENNVTLTAEDEQAIKDQLASDIVNSCGEGATEEDFFAYMAETYLTRDLYNRMNAINYLYQGAFKTLYGDNGELVDDETAMAYLEDNGYLSATHILLMTTDSSTGAALSEEEIAEKKASADSLLEQLKGISDTDELVAKFAELKAEYCDDTGKTLFPDGYTFLPGEMVAEFENACTALEPYGLSEVIETSYGYHIIMRLPLNVDAVIEYTDADSPVTARSLHANKEYGEKLQAYLDALEIEYAEGFELPDLLGYIA